MEKLYMAIRDAALEKKAPVWALRAERGDEEPECCVALHEGPSATRGLDGILPRGVPQAEQGIAVVALGRYGWLGALQGIIQLSRSLNIM